VYVSLSQTFYWKLNNIFLGKQEGFYPLLIIY
jgi:hypothetical protein